VPTFYCNGGKGKTKKGRRPRPVVARLPIPTGKNKSTVLAREILQEGEGGGKIGAPRKTLRRFNKKEREDIATLVLISRKEGKKGREGKWKEHFRPKPLTASKKERSKDKPAFLPEGRGKGGGGSTWSVDAGTIREVDQGDKNEIGRRKGGGGGESTPPNFEKGRVSFILPKPEKKGFYQTPASACGDVRRKKKKKKGKSRPRQPSSKPDGGGGERIPISSPESRSRKRERKGRIRSPLHPYNPERDSRGGGDGADHWEMERKGKKRKKVGRRLPCLQAGGRDGGSH